MNIEQTLRVACAPREPASEFEEAVMARVSAAAWRASHGAARRQRRIVLIVSLCVAGAAAATLATWYSGFAPPVEASLPSAIQSDLEASPDVLEVAKSAAPVMVPIATTVPPTETNLTERCTAAASAPPGTPSYTVLVQPLQVELDDPDIQSSLQQYYNAVLGQLRNVPGLRLVGTEAQTTTATPADFRLTVAGIDNRDADLPADRAEWQVKLQLEIWTGNTFGKAIYTKRPGSSMYSSDCRLLSGPVSKCGPAGMAAQDAGALMGRPGDPVIRDARLSTFPTPAQVACSHEIQKFSRAQTLSANSRIQSSWVHQALERLAAEPTPTSRFNLWNSLRSQLRPDLAPQLVAALRESTDAALSKEVVTLLAVNFAGDPEAREALAAVAASGTDTLMRHVAERAMSGDGPWREYAVARVRDTSLPTEQRLEAWYWMADAMPLDQQKMSDTLAGALTSLQEGDGVRVLANLLAGTQKDPGGPGYGLAGQQGQLAMRQIGSVNQPVAPELLIACFDAEPNYITLGVLATRREDPRVASKLESIAADQTDPRLSRRAASLLSQPLDPPRTVPTGN